MKRFNGSKMSHGRVKVDPTRCPICSGVMRQFLGELRCTHIVKGKRSSGSDRRVVLHGSMATIRKRIRQKAAALA